MSSYFTEPVASVHDLRKLAEELYDISDECAKESRGVGETVAEDIKKSRLAAQCSAYRHAARLVEMRANELRRKADEEEGM